MNRVIISFILFCGAILSGCTTNLLAQKRIIEVKIDQKDFENNQLRALGIPSDMRALYYWKDSEGNLKACSQPPADVTKADTFGTSGNSTVKLSGSSGVLKNDIGANGNINTTTTALELGGRSEAVLIARELIYGICPLAINKDIDKEVIQQTLKAALDVVKEIAIKERVSAETSSALLTSQLNLDKKVLDESAKRLIALNFYDLSEKRRICIADAGQDNAKLKKCDQDYDAASLTILNKQ